VQGVDQRVNGGQTVFFRNIGQMRVSRGGRGAGVAEKYLDMTKAQAAFKQMCGETVSQGVNRDFFLIPQCVTTAFMAAWTPPRSMCVTAPRIRLGEPVALGNNQQGF
jgi:hypothetical protein